MINYTSFRTIEQLEDSLSCLQRELFDTQILQKDCRNAKDNYNLQRVTKMIKQYYKMIQGYEAGIITLRDREMFNQ